ncbi:hypothetical protein BDZ91DRAFT_410704 [Kalaharituber pfeilii]|nr:hypothetical protein BDZ91DRAFT_410704 [Kalaharituber pfeilii]
MTQWMPVIYTNCVISADIYYSIVVTMVERHPGKSSFLRLISSFFSVNLSCLGVSLYIFSFSLHLLIDSRTGIACGRTFIHCPAAFDNLSTQIQYRSIYSLLSLLLFFF